MKVAIIGAGFAGLSAAYNLSKKGIDVTVFEINDKPGGLAVGFENPNWNWSLEKHYHHWFTNDNSVLDLCKETGYEVIIKRPKTSTFLDNQIFQLDSPMSLLSFSKLSLVNRIRTGLVLAYLKFTPSWKSLENITAQKFLRKYNGEKAWTILWKPLFEKKFSNYANEIPASWFWARIKKRTPSLAYPSGGFSHFAEHLEKKIKGNKGKIIYETKVASISKKSGKLAIGTNKQEYLFDRVICTLPSPLFVSITKGLGERYKKKLLNLKGIGAINLVLSLKKPFLNDGTYWLNVNDLGFPFLAIVEHTNFMNKKHYNNENIIYIGNYLPHDHHYFALKASDLVSEFLPFLNKINPNFNKSDINNSYLFKAKFAQPIIPLNYSENIPALKTPIEGLYLANIQQVYPWDRGTNYAVELGVKVSELVINSQ